MPNVTQLRLAASAVVCRRSSFVNVTVSGIVSVMSGVFPNRLGTRIVGWRLTNGIDFMVILVDRPTTTGKPGRRTQLATSKRADAALGLTGWLADLGGCFMAAIDRKPERRKPIVVAGDCALRGETEAAATIRDLLDLARSLDRLNQAYRVGNSGAAPGKAIDRIHALRWMID